MSEKHNDRYIKWGIFAGAAIFSIFLLYLNIIYQYYPGDDMIFQMKIPEDGIFGTEKINSLGDLIESQINFYNNYHYRVFNHTILQALLSLPPIIFDVCNVIVFFWLPWPILKLTSTGNLIDYWIKYALLLLFIWVFHINLGWSYFPATGALNYTWMLIPQLWYVAELIRYLEGQDAVKGRLIGLSIVNALANENACIMLLSITLIAWWWTRKRQNNHLVLIIMIMILGGAFMLLSPSLGKRLDIQGHMAGGLLPHIREFTLRTGYYLIRYTPVLLILLFSHSRITPKSPRHQLLIVAFLSATFSMVLAPLFEPRSAVLGFFVLIMLMTSLTIGSWSGKALIILSIIATIISVYRLPFFQAQHTRHQINKSILESNKGKNGIVHLERYCAHSTKDFLLCQDCDSSPDAFGNRSAAAAYGIKAVALSRTHSKTDRRDRIFNEIKSTKSYLDKHVQNQIAKDVDIFHTIEDSGIDLIIRSVKKYDPYYIVRGSNKGLSKDLLLQLIPQKYRVFFLDNLEVVTNTEHPTLHHEGYIYNYFHIPYTDRYQYVLISEYKVDLHSPIGPLRRIDF